MPATFFSQGKTPGALETPGADRAQARVAALKDFIEITVFTRQALSARGSADRKVSARGVPQIWKKVTGSEAARGPALGKRRAGPSRVGTGGSPLPLPSDADCAGAPLGGGRRQAGPGPPSVGSLPGPGTQPGPRAGLEAAMGRHTPSGWGRFRPLAQTVWGGQRLKGWKTWRAVQG